MTETQVFSIFEHDDSVPDDDSHKRNESQHGCHAEIGIKQPESEERTKQAQRAEHYGKDGHRYLFEMNEHEDEQHEHRKYEGHDDLRDQMSVDARQTSVLDLYAFRYIHAFDICLDILHGNRLAAAILHVCGHGHSLLSTGMRHLGQAPGRSESRHLTKRH